MKFRVTGLALAGLMASSLILPGFAAEAEETAAEEKPTPGIYLDGELAETREFRLYNNVNYITIESFVSMMDREAIVEKEDGTVVVNSVSVADVIDMEDASEDGEDPENSLPLSEQEESGDPEPGEEELEEEAAQANVVEETLTITAVEGAKYLVANDRYLYVKNGLTSIDGELAAPVRVLAEIYNLDVGFDNETDCVYLTRQEDADAYLESGDTYYNGDTLYWLSRIIYAESGNQPLEGQIAVGNVVMNRVASPLFPNTIYDVLFQRNQFSPAISGSIYRDPSEGAMISAKLVMDGAVVLKNALFFNAAGLNSYASRTRPYVATIGNHAFYA